MPPRVATIIFILGVFWLFALNRQPKGKFSRALWIPVIWLLIAGSRNVGQWLDMSSPMDQGSRYIDGNPIDRTILTALMALGLVVLLQRIKLVQQILAANLPVLLYFFYCGFSSFWSDHPDVAFKRWFRGIGDLIMVLLIITDPDWLGAVKRIVIRVAFWLFPISLLFIRYYPDLGRGYNTAGSAMYWTGVTTDKNGLGMICLIFGFGLVWQVMDLYRELNGAKWTKALYSQAFVVLIMCWLLWESNSMTSISCFTLALGLMLAVARWQFARRPAVTTLLASFCIGASAMVLFGGLGFALEAIGRNPTLTGRTDVWQILLRFAQSPWIGSGYESFWLGDRLVKIGGLTSVGINEAHNGYLEIYLNLGWIGLGLLGLVILAGYRTVLSSIRENVAEGKVRAAYWMIPLIYNFTEAAFKMMSPVWIFFLVAIMAPRTTAAVEREPEIEATPAWKIPLPGARVGLAAKNNVGKRDRLTAARPRQHSGRP